MLKKLTAVFVCAGLVTSSFPVTAAAAVGASAGGLARGGVSAVEAMEFLKAQKVYTGDEDPVKSYLVSGGELTVMGHVLYDYLKAQHNPAEEVKGFEESLKALRKSGPSSDKKTQRASFAVSQYDEKFKALSGPENDEADTFRLGTLREAMMTGAAAADPPKQQFTQVETAEGWEFWDREGLAFRLNKHQVPVYNRDLQKTQRQMNETRSPQAPFVPETGRYNYPMLEYSYWRLEDQRSELDKAYHIDRMVSMAELLGKQFKDDMWFMDRTLEADLEADAKAKTFKHQGKVYSVFDIVEAKTKSRAEYLAKAKEGVTRFKGEIEKFKSIASISDNQVNSLQLHEQYVMRFLSLSFLESQKFHVKNMREKLDPSSPDYELLKRSILESPMDEATKQNYQKQGAKLLKRVERMMAAFTQLQGVLVSTDYAENLDLVQAALNQSQKELSELSMDNSLYAETPSLALLAKGELGKWLSTDGWAIRGYWKVAKMTGMDHGRYMDEVKRMLPQFNKAALDLSNGDYRAARALYAGIHPDAIKTYREISPKASTPRVTDMLRVTASMRKSRDILSEVNGVNSYVKPVGNFITWTVTLALFAPVMSMAFRGVSTVASWGAHVPVINFPARVIEEVAKHASARLDSLSPAPQNVSAEWVAGYLQASGIRLVNAGVRQGAFTLLSGTISGAFTAGTYYLDDERLPKADLYLVKTGEGHRLHNNGLEAFGEGFKGGATWANESFHPALGYIGLPSSIFEGTFLARPTQIVGQYGVTGSAMEMAKAAGIPISEKLSLAALAETGTLGKIAATPLSMIDNVGKYVLFSQAVGAAAEKASWHLKMGDGGTWWFPPSKLAQIGLNDEKDIERRIKRSQQANMTWADSPVWLLIPVHPEHQAGAAAEYMRSRQGMEEYAKAGRLSEIANAGENASLPLLGKVQIPVSQWIFNTRWKGEPAEGATFHVGKELKREAIAKELVEAIPSSRRGAKLGDINPMEFFKVSRLPDTEMVGKLHVNEEVRLQARELFDQAVLSNKELAQKVLSAKPGENVSGFGRVNSEIKKEVALSLYLKEGVGKNVKASEAAPGTIPAGKLTLEESVAKLLKPYLNSNDLPKPAAEKFLEAVRQAKGESPKLDAALDTMLGKVLEWKNGQNNPASPYKNKSYMDLIGELKNSASESQRTGALTPQEAAVLIGLYDYIGAIEARFNSFNKSGMAHQISSDIIAAKRQEYVESANPQAVKLLDSFAERLGEWRKSQGAADSPALSGSNRGYTDMLAKFDGEIRSAGGSRGLDHAQVESLRSAVREMEAAPWVLHDSKGSALPSWRPEQFEGLMTSLKLVANQGRGGQPIRQFIRLKTGGGKTMLAFEGLLPLAEADAAFHSKLSNGAFGEMEVMFLTVQSNLDAQARMEFMAYKKIGSGLKFETYEGLKTQIAEGKLYARDVVKKTWILGDEMDGAALQPMLTIGEVTAKIMKKGSSYHLLEKIQGRMESSLTLRARDQAEAVKSEVRRLEAYTKRLDPHSPEAKASGKAVKILLNASEGLSSGVRRQAIEASIREALGEIKTTLESKPLSQSPETLLKLTKSAEQLSSLAEKLGKRSSKATLKKIDGLLREQQATIDAAGLAQTTQGRAVKSAAESLRARLSAAKDPAALVRETAKTQTEALNAGGRPDPAAVSEIRLASERILNLIGQGGTPTAAELGLAAKEAKTYLKQQENVLEKIHDKPTERTRALGEKAHDLRVEAEKKLAALEKNGGSSSALRSEIEMLRNFEGLKSKDAGAMGQAQKLFTQDAAEIMSLMNGAAPDAQAALARLKQRWKLIDSFAQSESPIYSIYRSMKNDVYPMANSVLRTGPDQAKADMAVRAWQHRLDGNKSLTGLAYDFLKTKLIGRETAGGGRTRQMAIDQIGLTRIRAVELLKAIMADPTLPPGQRFELFWTVMPSALWSRGVTGRGSSWVRTEMMNLARGFFEDPATIRMDSNSKSIHVIHNGQWFESMDNPGRRFWELEYNSDLTLPYKHRTVSTIKDITQNPKSRFISLSGTAGEEYLAHTRANGVLDGGTGSKAPENVRLDVRPGPSSKITSVSEALKAADHQAANRVVVNARDPQLSPAVKTYLESKGLAKKDAVVLDISELPSGAARKALEALRQTQNSKGLVVLSLSDTKLLKAISKYLIRSGQVKPNEIAKVFSDTEYLRQNHPKANVTEQMNLAGLNDGTVRVLMLDTRVGGRGLDLNFKGERDNPDPAAFKGYTHFEMLIIDPQKVSSVHQLQSMGRIDLGRVLMAASRRFALVLDVKEAQSDPIFRKMVETEGLFAALRKDPEVLKFSSNKAASEADWAAIHDYMLNLEKLGTHAERLSNYKATVEKHLQKKQLEVERDQLRQSSVLDGQGTPDPRLRGLEN